MRRFGSIEKKTGVDEPGYEPPTDQVLPAPPPLVRTLERKEAEEQRKLQAEQRTSERQSQEELARINRESEAQQSQTEAEVERAGEG